MNLKQALQRIEELERKVKELEARPHINYHFHNQPTPAIAPYVIPNYPMPQPYQSPWIVTCGNFAQ